MLQIIPNILIISKITLINSLINQMTRMFTFKKLSFLLTVCLALHVSLFGQVTNSVEPQKENIFDRKSNFNVEELKVRWKKAALENCPGVPCTIVPPPPSFTCGTSTVLDGNGNSYNTVTIGTQCWTKQNLKATLYNDGITPIPDETNNAVGWGTLNTGARAEYVASGVTGYVSNYGYLYNWYAAAGIITAGGTSTKNICPIGWRVPSDTDWTNLTTLLGTNVGGKLKSTATGTSTAGWISPNTNATDQYGFSVLPGGFRLIFGGSSFFSSVSYAAYFWSASEQNTYIAWYRVLHFNSGDLGRNNSILNNGSKSVGASVRCLKD
jgi:uncharacterized protein (TIGR02145 family)